MFVEAHRAAVIRNPGHVFPGACRVNHADRASGNLVDKLDVLWESKEVAGDVAIPDCKQLITHPRVAAKCVGVEAVQLLVAITIDVSGRDPKRVSIC